MNLMRNRHDTGQSQRATQPRLPTFSGKGLQAGVDLDDSATLLDLMQEGDTPS